MKYRNALGFAAALLAGSALSSAAYAQDSTTLPKIQKEGAGSPSAKPDAPGQQKLHGPAVNEMAPGQQKKSGNADSAAEVAPGQVKPEVGQADATSDKKPNANAATDAAPGQQQKTGEADAKDAAPGQQQKTGEADAKDSAPGQVKQDQAADQKPSNEKTGSIDISTEQKTEIRTIIQEAKVEPVDIDIDLRIGVAVPRTVEFHPLPPRFVEIVPQYRGYEYFILADGRIIIVKPDTYEVVYILVV